MSVTIKVEGLDQLQKALSDLPKATGRNVLKRALIRQAEPIAQTARSMVPVFEGHLKASIHVATKLTRRQRRQHKKVHKDDVEIFVGPGSDPAAHLVEYGSIHNDPQPFMRPAWDRHKDKVIDGFADDIWNELEKALKRVFGKAVRG